MKRFESKTGPGYARSPVGLSPMYPSSSVMIPRQIEMQLGRKVVPEESLMPIRLLHKHPLRRDAGICAKIIVEDAN